MRKSWVWGTGMAGFIFWLFVVGGVLWLLSVLRNISRNTDDIRGELQESNRKLGLLRDELHSSNKELASLTTSLRPPASEIFKTPADEWIPEGTCKICGRSDGGHSSACVDYREHPKQTQF